jgi:hypothetical protein
MGDRDLIFASVTNFISGCSLPYYFYWREVFMPHLWVVVQKKIGFKIGLSFAATTGVRRACVFDPPLFCHYWRLLSFERKSSSY